EVLRKGDDVSVLVLGVDPENKRISLGLKQTTDDPWDEIAARFTSGVESSATVVRLVEDGVVVDLGDDIEGFVPASAVPVPPGKDIAAVLGEGQTIDLRVQETDAVNRRIVLSVTQMPEPPVRKAEPESEAEVAPADASAEVESDDEESAEAES